MTVMQRSTRQRSAIVDAFRAAGRPLSPQEVLDAAGVSIPALGIATVYRNLKSMTEAGVLQVVSLPGQNPLYELTTARHHHHFQCTLCHRVFDVEGCPGDLSGLAPQGFVVAGHEITLYGRCRDCGQVPGSAVSG